MAPSLPISLIAHEEIRNTNHTNMSTGGSEGVRKEEKIEKNNEEEKEKRAASLEPRF